MPPLLAALPELDLEPVPRIRYFRDVPVARSVRFNQIIATGPPGAGKSTFIRRLGGWPEEGYVDLSRKGWWRAQALAVRPREVHLGLPFVGHKAGLALFDEEWREHWDSLELDTDRILVLPEQHFLLSVNWRNRFVFEFLLPPPEQIIADRRERARAGTHLVDQQIDPGRIHAQVRLFGRVADHFHRNGMQVYLRARTGDHPLRFVAETQTMP